MKRLFIVLLVMVMVGSLFSEQVMLKNGAVLKGDIRGKSGDKIYIYYPSREIFVGISNDILRKITDENDNDITANILERDNFNQDIDFSNCYDYAQLDKSNPKPVQPILDLKGIKYDDSSISYTKLNPAMLALGASLAVLAWDSFADAGDISDTIKNYKDLGLKTSKLEKTKDRKNAIGAVLAVSSIITFVYSFEEVEVQASPTSLSLSYKF
jgi:hypothetical protein